MKRLLLGILLLAPVQFVIATEDALTEEQQAFNEWADEFAASLDFQEGVVTLGNGIATLNMPEEFVYLSPVDAERLLTEGWGNPPGNVTLGMIMPAGVHPLAYESWGVIIEYVEDGYVSDEDAAEIDFDSLLSDMQSGQEESNAERAEMGYEPISLVGWAEPPHYNAEEHKLYWAQDLKFGEAEENTLNYNVRVLGRRGMLVMNAVANMSQLEQVRVDMQKVLAFSDFAEGNRYQDFDPSTDEVAAYGIAAVVAGKLAAKAGLFAKLLALLIAFKKVIIGVVIGLALLARRIFTGKAGVKELAP